MLETIREFAREMLQASGEEAAARGRHARYIVGLVEEVEPRLYGPEQLLWIALLAAEQDNVRAALRWLLDGGEFEAVGRLLRRLLFFWWLQGRKVEAQRWAEEVLALGAGIPLAVRARAHLVVGFSLLGWSAETAAAHFREARALARAAGDRWVEGHSLVWEGFLAPLRGDIAGGLAQMWEGQRILREAGDEWGVGISLVGLSALSLFGGRLDDAEHYAEQYLALARRMGDQRSIAHACEPLAVVALLREDRDRALALLNASLLTSVEVGHVELAAHVVMDLAVAAAREQPVHAARLFGAAEALREEIGAAIWPSRRPLYEQALGTVRDALGTGAFAAAWGEGLAMTLERAVEYALQHEASPPLAPSSAAGITALSHCDAARASE
jgi:hypothetical protein